MNPRWRVLAVTAVSLIGLVIFIVGLRWLLDRGPAVAMIGDSITVVSADEIRTQLDDFDVNSRAVIGATVRDMLPAAEELARYRPEHLVINLGSNDTRLYVDVRETELHLRTMLSKFPDARCVTMVSINAHMNFDSKIRDEEANAINGILLRLAGEDQRISIVDWNTMVNEDLAAHDGVSTLNPDTVHPNAKGQRALTAEIFKHLERCRVRTSRD